MLEQRIESVTGEGCIWEFRVDTFLYEWQGVGARRYPGTIR